jgi:aspartyl-tRNA(Asn)/glutamyl-tRNA(Gln) amidotransferase subunit B
MRTKEDAADYRYFPDPDLPPLVISKEWIASLEQTAPEMPEPRANRFITDYLASPEQAKLATSSKAFADYFERVLLESADASAAQIERIISRHTTEDDRALVATFILEEVARARLRIAANWMVGEVLSRLKRSELDITGCPITPSTLATLVKRVEVGKISTARESKCWKHFGRPAVAMSMQSSTPKA